MGPKAEPGPDRTVAQKPDSSPKALRLGEGARARGGPGPSLSQLSLRVPGQMLTPVVNDTQEMSGTLSSFSRGLSMDP